MKLDLLCAKAIGYRLRSTSAFAMTAITTTSLPDALIGTPYNQMLQATSDLPIFQWTVDAGTLPPGLSLDSFTGRITGTPLQPGTYNFTVRLRDYHENSPGITRALSVVTRANLLEKADGL